MVLQDVNSTPDSFSDNPYSSDNDAYSSNAPSGRRFDDSNLAQPIPILGPVLGFYSASTRRNTEATLKYAELKIHRPLTADEAQGLAEHLYKLEQTKSYYMAGATGLGVYRWYQTWDKCKYPFVKVKEGAVDPNKFLFVKGPWAQYARQSWRFSCYWIVARQLGWILGQVVGQPQVAAATAADPRLTQLRQDLNDSRQQQQPWSPDQSRQKNADERRRAWEEAARARQEAKSTPGTPPQAPWSARKPTPADDDMSPTAGNEPWPSESDSSWSESAFAPEPTPAAQPPQQQPVTPSRQPQRRPTRQSDDDAFPTGGMFQDEVEGQSNAGGSAWDRLRRGGAPPPQQGPPPSRNRERRPPPHQEQREGSTLGDSFTFVDSEDERRKERERAQREFDARIEQERQGKDFNEERRW